MRNHSSRDQRAGGGAILLLLVAAAAVVVCFLLFRGGDDPWVLNAKADYNARLEKAKAWTLQASAGGETAIRKALADASPNVRQPVVMALEFWSDPKSIDLLQESLKDSVDFVRKSAAVVLGHKKARSAVGALIEALSDPDPKVQNVVCEALGKITGEPFGKDPEKWKAWWKEKGAEWK